MKKLQLDLDNLLYIVLTRVSLKSNAKSDLTLMLIDAST